MLSWKFAVAALVGFSATLVGCSPAGPSGPSGPIWEEFDPVAETMADLHALYALDGDVVDRARSGIDGEVFGATPTEDRFGRGDHALLFEGGHYVAFDDRLIADQTQWFTISLWFQTDSTQKGTLFHEGEANGPGIWVRVVPKNNRIVAHSRDAFTIKTESAFNDGAWHHLVLRASESSVSIWIDGQLQVESDWSEDFLLKETPNAAVIGREGGPESDVELNYFRGALDDMAVFHRPLSGKEIKLLFKDGPNQRPSARAEANPLGFDVALDGTESRDADGEIVSYAWDFGDGTTSEGETAEHTYEEPGIYEVTLIVTDDEGATSETTVIVEISDPNDHSDAGPWPVEWAEFEQLVLDLVNIERGKGAVCGGQEYPAVGPVETNGFCRLAARKHSEDMATQGYFSHTGLNGSTPFDRMAAAGYEGPMPWGENIAAGQPSPESVVQGWMQSPGHCRNIMNGDYKVLGVGYYRDPASDMTHYWTQNFGGGH